VCLCVSLTGKDTGEKDVPARDRRAVILQVENRKVKEKQRLNALEEEKEKEVCAATHCNTLQHAATHCNTLQHTATHCNMCHMLQHTAV